MTPIASWAAVQWPPPPSSTPLPLSDLPGGLGKRDQDEWSPGIVAEGNTWVSCMSAYLSFSAFNFLDWREEIQYVRLAKKFGANALRVVLWAALVISLPNRVINFKFPLHPHQKCYITQFGELRFP